MHLPLFTNVFCRSEWHKDDETESLICCKFFVNAHFSVFSAFMQCFFDQSTLLQCKICFEFHKCFDEKNNSGNQDSMLKCWNGSCYGYNILHSGVCTVSCKTGWNYLTTGQATNKHSWLIQFSWISRGSARALVMMSHSYIFSRFCRPQANIYSLPVRKFLQLTKQAIPANKRDVFMTTTSSRSLLEGQFISCLSRKLWVRTNHLNKETSAPAPAQEFPQN